MQLGILRSLTWLTFLAGIVGAFTLAWNDRFDDLRGPDAKVSLPTEPTAAGLRPAKGIERRHGATVPNSTVR